METQICVYCKHEVPKEVYFCPNCGKKLKEPPVSKTLLAQIGLYAVSILFPPFGLFPALKYLKQNDQTAKNIGIIAILLTVISIIVGIWLSINIVTQVQTQLNQQVQLQSAGLGL